MLLTMFQYLRQIFVVNAEETTGTTRATSKGKVVVGGGSGFVGSDLCKLLARKQYEVIVVSRSSNSKSTGHLTWEELEKSGLPKGTTAVVNLSGQNVLDPLQRWTVKFQQLVYSSRIDTTKALRDAIIRCPTGERPKSFVQVTGVGFYPPSNQSVYDESSPGGEHDFLAKLVVDLEEAGKIPKEIAERDAVRNVWIRSGVVLGRNGGLIGNVFWQFFFGLGGRMGSGQQPMAWIHVKDLSGLIVHSVENENVQGVLNGVAPQLITNQDFVDAFAKSLSRPAFLPVPEFVWKIVFGSQRASMITEGQKVVPKRVLESGYVYRFPKIEAACDECAQVFYKDKDDL